MRENRSKFASPLELDIPLPSRGIDYLTVNKTDFEYCRSSTNMWISPSGNLETRPSMIPIFQGIGRVTGLFYTKLFDTTLAVFNGSYDLSGKWVKGDNMLYKWDGTSLSSIGKLSGANLQVRIIEFLGKVFFASGGQLQQWDGTTLSVPAIKTGGNPIPSVDFIDTWQERLWGFRDQTLYISGYRDAGEFGATSGTATGFTGGFIEIRPNDGTNISGFCIFQGGIYVTKSSEDGVKASFWTIEGSSFNATSTDPFAVKMINDAVGCVNPHTMCPTLNTVIFVGEGGTVYTEENIDVYAQPQSVAINQRVAPAFKGANSPLCAAYQPMLGYYVLLMGNESTSFSEIWAHHVGTKGWWRWELINNHPTCVSAGHRNELLIGDVDGVVYRLDEANYGIDGGNNITKRQSYTSGLTFGIIDANSTRDKFFEWLFVDYLPLGESGQMWVDYREGRGYTYAYTGGLLSGGAQTSKTIGWDYAASIWDTETVGWDMGGTVEVANRINRRTSTLQVALNANTPFRLIGVAVTGGVIATKFRSWSRSK
jgi:hypothetical protein